MSKCHQSASAVNQAISQKFCTLEFAPQAHMSYPRQMTVRSASYDINSLHNGQVWNSLFWKIITKIRLV